MRNTHFFCICKDVYKIYEGDDFDKLYEVLSEKEDEKMKIGTILSEKYRNMNENPYFEQKFNLRTATGI